MPDKSMEPTLGHKQYLVFKKYFHTVLNPHRGDIVLYLDPESRAASVGRVIILPSEKFTISEGSIYIDDGVVHRLEEPYLGKGVKNQVDIEGIWFELGKIQYLILADDRSNKMMNFKQSTFEKSNIVGILWIAPWYPKKCSLISYCPNDF